MPARLVPSAYPPRRHQGCAPCCGRTYRHQWGRVALPWPRAAATTTSRTWRSHELLNKVCDGLLGHHDCSTLHMISKANSSTNALVGIIFEIFPGFCDYVDLDEPNVALSHGWEVARGAAPTSGVHFHKRAQIVVACLWAALGRCRCRASGGIGSGGRLPKPAAECASSTPLAS
jgi:hypothetical protein